jgi:hypothetical protein
MINLAREPLRGEVEVDDTWVAGSQAGLRGSRQLKGRKAALVVVAVERGRTTGRARIAVIPDFKNTTLLAFLKQNVAPDATIYTDGLKTFTGYKRPASSMYLGSNPSASSCGKARSPWSLWPIALLATSSNGSSEPTTV